MCNGHKQSIDATREPRIGAPGRLSGFLTPAGALADVRILMKCRRISVIRALRPAMVRGCNRTYLSELLTQGHPL